MTANELDQFIQQNNWKTAQWEENGDHDALADITATKDCFFELKRRGIIRG